MSEELIDRMARKRAEAMGKDWFEMTSRQRAKHADAMWEALHALLDPTDEMLAAGSTGWVEATQKITMTGTFDGVTPIGKATAGEAFKAMIGKLLEVR